MARLRDPNRTAKNDGFGHTPYPSLSQQFLGRETVTYVSNIYKYYVTYRLITDQQDRRKAAKAGGWEAQVKAALARRAMSSRRSRLKRFAALTSKRHLMEISA